jgi:hypothetical protein
MLKNGRIYFYLLITALICFLNFLLELEEEGVNSAILEAVIGFPSILLFIFLVYKSRQLLCNIQAIKVILKNEKSKKKYVIISVFIAFKALFITLIGKKISNMFFDDDHDGIFFDISFLAILAISTVVIMFIYFLESFIVTVRNKHSIEIQLAEYEKEKIISKYILLKNQLNPHFLFNSFNSLISLISIDQKRAENFVQELSNIYRYNLTKTDELVTSVKDEIEMIHSYITLQKIRFGGSLIYSEIIEEEFENFLIPPMTLQTLVENAIKHNKVSIETPLVISIITEDDRIIVRNNLQLKNKKLYKKDSLGIGVQNLRNQLAILHTEKPTFEIQGDYYVATIPMIKNEIDD